MDQCVVVISEDMPPDFPDFGSRCLTGPAKFVVLSLMAKLDKDDSKKYSTPKDRNMTLRRDLKTALAAAPFLWETSRSDFADGLWRALKDRTRCGATMHKDGAFRLLEHPFPIPSAQCADARFAKEFVRALYRYDEVLKSVPANNFWTFLQRDLLFGCADSLSGCVAYHTNKLRKSDQATAMPLTPMQQRETAASSTPTCSFWDSCFVDCLTAPSANFGSAGNTE